LDSTQTNSSLLQKNPNAKLGFFLSIKFMLNKFMIGKNNGFSYYKKVISTAYKK